MISFTADTHATLSVNGRQVFKGSFPEASWRTAKIYARYKFHAPLRNAMAKIMAVIVQSSVERMFDDMQSSWSPLSFMTLEAKSMRGLSPKTLIASGRMSRTGNNRLLFNRRVGVGRRLVYVRDDAAQTDPRNKATRTTVDLGFVASKMETGMDYTVSARQAFALRAHALNGEWPRSFLPFRPGKHVSVPARPFFVPGIERARPEVEDAVTRALMAILARRGVRFG